MKLNNSQKVLRHLKESGKISPLEALIVHRIVRLAPRIMELRDLGHEILTCTKSDEAGTSYTSYELAR